MKIKKRLRKMFFYYDLYISSFLVFFVYLVLLLSLISRNAVTIPGERYYMPLVNIFWVTLVLFAASYIEKTNNHVKVNLFTYDKNTRLPAVIISIFIKAVFLLSCAILIKSIVGLMPYSDIPIMHDQAITKKHIYIAFVIGMLSVVFRIIMNMTKDIAYIVNRLRGKA